jgi:hypothetical protein
MRVPLLAGAFLAAAAQPGATGPWPRGEDKTFLSFSYEATVDTTDPFLELQNGFLFYGERGLTPKTTLVLDGSDDGADDQRTLIAGLSRSLAAPDATHQFSVLGGIGTTRDPAGSSTFPVIGASWGRGIETRWGGGWTAVDTQYRAAGGSRALTKIDATLGVRPNDQALLFGQIQLSDAPGSEPAARLAVTMVLDLTKTLKAELGVLYGVMNDDDAGVRSGIWLDF